MRRLAIPLLILALLAAACGEDDSGGGGSGATAESCPDGAAVIKMADIKFDPEEATAKAGQEVCWINEDSIDHNAVAESGADFESDLFGKGQTFTTTVEQPGTVAYVCTIHPGMTGTLKIEAR
jgi:plastocyanin